MLLPAEHYAVLHLMVMDCSIMQYEHHYTIQQRKVCFFDGLQMKTRELQFINELDKSGPPFLMHA